MNCNAQQLFLVYMHFLSSSLLCHRAGRLHRRHGDPPEDPDCRAGEADEEGRADGDGAKDGAGDQKVVEDVAGEDDLEGKYGQKITKIHIACTRGIQVAGACLGIEFGEVAQKLILKQIELLKAHFSKTDAKFDPPSPAGCTAGVAAPRRASTGPV